jgi:transposase-like protein
MADRRTNLLKLVSYAAATADVAMTKRDATMREAHRAGASVHDIAAAAGVSHSAALRVIERSG